MSRLRTPTIYDVAEMAGVSISTVSRVLNSPYQVNSNTRNRVQAAIDELGYVPKAAARERARRALDRIGIITPFFFTYPSFVQRMRGVASVLADTPSELVIYPVDSLDRLHGYYAMLSATRRVDGLIIMSLPIDNASAQRLKKSILETVLIESSHPSFNSIEIDDRGGGELAAGYLLEKGHRRCAFVGYGELPDYSLHPGDLRLDGYRHKLAEGGASLPDAYVRRLPFNQTESRQQIYELLDLPEPPTAIFAAADDLALLVLRFARERGIKVPEDLAVIGFDDLDVMDHIGLTTIRQSLDDSGRMAAEVLLSRLNGPPRPVQHIKLQLTIVERETV